MKDVREQLTALIQKRRQAQIALHNTKVYNTNGYPLRLGKQLLLVQSISEFHLDGYYIFDVSSIKSVRSNKYERTFERILRAEGQTSQVADLPGITLEDWRSALRDLKALNEKE